MGFWENYATAKRRQTVKTDKCLGGSSDNGTWGIFFQFSNFGTPHKITQKRWMALSSNPNIGTKKKIKSVRRQCRGGGIEVEAQNRAPNNTKFLKKKWRRSEKHSFITHPLALDWKRLVIYYNNFIVLGSTLPPIMAKRYCAIFIPKRGKLTKSIEISAEITQIRLNLRAIRFSKIKMAQKSQIIGSILIPPMAAHYVFWALCFLLSLDDFCDASRARARARRALKLRRHLGGGRRHRRFGRHVGHQGGEVQLLTTVHLDLTWCIKI